MWMFDPRARRQLTHPDLDTAKKLKSTESRILELLIAHQGQAVSKQDILNAVWGNTIVSTSSITQSIAQIRIALGDNGRDQLLIKTLPRQGYMLKEGSVAIVQPTLNVTIKPRVIRSKACPSNSHNPQNVKETKSSNVKIKFFQSGVLITLIMCILVLFIWLMTIYSYSVSITTKKWEEEHVADMSYFYEATESGRNLFDALKGTYPTNVSKIFLSKSPEQIYVSCIYRTSKFNEINSANLSFSSKYTEEQIKEGIYEQCK